MELIIEILEELIIEILEVFLDNSISTARTSQLGDIILTIR